MLPETELPFGTRLDQLILLLLAFFAASWPEPFSRARFCLEDHINLAEVGLITSSLPTKPARITKRSPALEVMRLPPCCLQDGFHLQRISQVFVLAVAEIVSQCPGSQAQTAGGRTDGRGCCK